MKKHRLFLFTILLMVLALPQSVFAYDFSAVAPTGQTLYYTIVSGGVCVAHPNSYSPYWSDNTKPTGALTIPSTVTHSGTTYNVIGIVMNAFSGCTGLTSVTIPSSVTFIGGYTFYGCTGLTSVTIPNSVTSIDGYTFYGCTGLTSVTIPSSVTSIGSNAFNRCTGLTSVTIGSSVTSIGGGAFASCSGLSVVNFNALSCTFSSSVVSSPFSGCTSLTTLNIGDGVTNIPHYAFNGCTGLTSVTIPNSVIYIGNVAFSGCSGLTSVTIGNSVTAIGFNAFADCSGLTSVTIPNSVTYIGENAFNSCTGLTSVTIPSSVTGIDEGAFAHCSGLTSITVNSANTVYDSRGNCNAIIETSTNSLIAGCQNTIIPSSVTSISGNAFFGCTGLTSVTIPSSVTSIGGSAFNGCTGLTSVTIPNSVTSINWYAFSGCTGLTSVTIPNSVTSIGGYTFYGCTSLTSVTIPSSVTSIGSNAFNGCTGLTSVTIGSSVTTIGNSAFYNCTGLASVTIPNSVTSIGSNAFYHVRHIEYHGTATGAPWGAIFMNVVTDGDFIFSDSSRTNLLAYIGSGGSVSIPSTVTSIGNGAFYGCTGLTSITIPQRVTSIGNYAFGNCTGLSTVNYYADSCIYFGEYQNWAFSGSSVSNVNIGSDVKIIPEEAFAGSHNLRSVIIPDSVNYIGVGAFGTCSMLDSVVIGSSVASIDSYAFENCPNLNYVKVYCNTPPSLGSSAFIPVSNNCTVFVPCHTDSVYRVSTWGNTFSNIVADCSDPSSTYYDFWAIAPSGDTLYYIILDSNRVTVVHPFASDTTEQAWWGGAVQPTGSLTIPATVTHNDTTYTVVRISEHAFYNCSAITSVTIPNTVDSIGEWAFAYSTSLGSVTLGSAVTTIGYGAFYGCTGLSLLVIPDSLTTIGSHAFSIPNCHVSAVSIPSTVTTIGDHAFSGWGDLTTLTIPRSVTYIGDWAFAACTSLATVNFYADSCSYMGSTTAPVFDGDIHIQTLHIGNTVKTIPANAFYGCSGIGTVTIPASVSSIGSHAFAGCTGLTSITSKRAIAPVAGANAFDNIPASTPVYIPCGSTASYASRWNHFSNFIEVMDAHVWVRSSDAAMGTASVTVQPTCANPSATIVATPNAGYLFALWSDGDTLNPRTLTIDRDTLLTALFVPVPDTVINYDTIVVHDTLLIHDTTIINNYIHDTTVVHDTAYVDVFVHDTTIVHDTVYVDVFVHDTTIVHDTAYIDVYVHDTIIVNNYIHDTTIVRDTAYIENYIHDTITVMMPIDYYTLTLISAQPTMGIVVGSGTYSDSTEVEIAAVAICGYHFVQWSDGNAENPRHVTVTADQELTATFDIDEVGISDVSASNAKVSVQDNVITVQGAEGQRVRIFDAVGRLLSTEQSVSETQHFRVMAAGVYLVQMGNSTAQRVVVGITR